MDTRKWEYRAVWVHEAKVPTGEKGLLGGDKKKEVWCATGDDGTLPLNDVINSLGESGWEMVAAVQSWAMHGGNVPFSHTPAHWLYFKRPKG